MKKAGIPEPIIGAVRMHFSEAIKQAQDELASMSEDLK
jgi:hypothetical protein